MINDRPAIEVISKIWGFEKRIIHNDKYCGKLLYIVKGKHTSLHYHKVKDETFFVHSGKVHVFFFDGGLQEFEKKMANTSSDVMNVMERATLNSGDNFCVPPGRLHQIFSVEDTVLYEFSTTYEEIGTVRLTEGG